MGQLTHEDNHEARGHKNSTSPDIPSKTEHPRNDDENRTHRQFYPFVQLEVKHFHDAKLKVRQRCHAKMHKRQRITEVRGNPLQPNTAWDRDKCNNGYLPPFFSVCGPCPASRVTMNAQMHGEETIEPRMRALDADPGREKDPHSYEQRKGGSRRRHNMAPGFRGGRAELPQRWRRNQRPGAGARIKSSNRFHEATHRPSHRTFTYCFFQEASDSGSSWLFQPLQQLILTI